MGQKKKQVKLTSRELCYIGIFAAIIAICAQISIPQPGGVPFTLQAWAISLAGLVLGAKNATIATVVYIILGAVGAPVFAEFSGGFGVILRPTGGFILSFPIMALLAGLPSKKGGVIWQLLGLSAGSIINLGAGLFWFNRVTELGLAVSFSYSVAPFIIITIVRTAVLPLIGRKITSAMQKANLDI